MIKRLRRLQYPVPLLYKVLNVSVSRYYAWLNKKPSARFLAEGRPEVEVLAAHKRTRKTCGNERLQKDLAEHGVNVGIYRVRKIRKKLGIK